MTLTSGIDLATPAHGNNLYSMTNGEVITKVYEEGGFGHYIIIKRRRRERLFVWSYEGDKSAFGW